MRADKQKVVNEVWDDERIRSFLDKGPMGDENHDFSLLLHAYRSMRLDDFERFISLFKEAGYDINATSSDGHTLAQTIADHSKSAPFIALLT